MSAFQRSLALPESLAIVTGRILGSGIFRTPGPIFLAVCALDTNQSYAPDGSNVPLAQLSLGLFFLAWIIGAVATFLSSLCYAELISMIPRSGGPYAYLRCAYPEWITFLRGWAMFFVSETASIVAVALVFSEYGNILLQELWGIQLSKHTLAMLALALIWLCTYAAWQGMAFSGLLQNILSFLKLSALLSMSLLFFTSSEGKASHLQHYLWPEEWGWESLIALGGAMRYCFFAYSGWEGASYVAEEVKEPRRTLPRSLFWGIGLLGLLYLLVNASYVYILGPLGIIAEGRQIAAAAMKIALGSEGLLVLALFVMLSTGANVSTQVLVKARTWHAMARDGLFFRPLAQLHPQSKSPNAAITAQALWASVLVGCSLFFTNSYESIIDFFSFTSTLFNLLTFLALWILRSKIKEQKQASFFRISCLPCVLLPVLIIQGSFLLITLYDRPLESLLGLLLTLSGLLYYFFAKKSAKQREQTIP